MAVRYSAEGPQIAILHRTERPIQRARFADVSGDGRPELRAEFLDGPPSPDGGYPSAVVETFTVQDGRHVPWSGPDSPLIDAIRAECGLHAPCDPVLDVRVSEMPTPEGGRLVHAEGPESLCGTGGCPGTVWYIPGEGARPSPLLHTDGFGSLHTGDDGAPCVTDADDYSWTRHCFHDGQLRRVAGGTNDAEAP
jgi:hypothetical protein